MTREESVGIIVFRKQKKNIEYLLLFKTREAYWNFPKGRREQGEESLETAFRETEEETGITKDKIRIIENFKEGYDYDFDTEIKNGVREKIYKHDSFYLAEIIDTDVKLSEEHNDFGWYDYDAASKKIHYKTIQDVLTKAHRFLLSQQDFVL